MLELDIIKQQCRIEQDFIEDDGLLDTMLTPARRLIENDTGRTLYATAAEIPKDDAGQITDQHALLLDDDITTAMLLLIGNWYASREAAVIGTISSKLPFAIDSLILPYRHYHFEVAMRAGKLRHRITIEQPGSAQDPDTGEMVDGWAPVATVWASVEPLSAREFIAAQAGQSEITARVKIRYRAGITAGMRLLHKGQVFNIHGVLPDLDSGIEYLTLPVSQGVNDG